MLFTGVLRCNTISPKGKGQNLISSNLIAGIYLPASLFTNTNVHTLLNPGHLPTTALPKRLSLIFLWTEFPRRDPIPIVNPLLYTVCIFEGWWSAHSYLFFSVRLHDWFRNRPPLLMLNYWQRDDKLKVFWEHKLWVKLHIESVLEE